MVINSHPLHFGQSARYFSEGEVVPDGPKTGEKWGTGGGQNPRFLSHAWRGEWEGKLSGRGI